MRKQTPRQAREAVNSLIGVSGKTGLEPCPCLIAECVHVTAVPQAASDRMLMPPAKQMWAVFLTPRIHGNALVGMFVSQGWHRKFSLPVARLM